MQKFYDDVQKPSAANTRIQAAANSLGYILKVFLGKEVPLFVNAAYADQFTTDTNVEKMLYKELVDLVDSNPKRASELLDSGTAHGNALKDWWIGYHEARRDHSVEAVRLVNLTKDVEGNVSIYHEAGVCTHWITKGTASWPDPDSRVNELTIPWDKLTVRTGEDAGGEFKYLTYPSNANFHNIVRAEKGRLVAGATSQPNWML